MQIYVQYQERGDITQIWTEDDDSQGHVFVLPQAGYAQAKVDAPASLKAGATPDLEAIQANFRVSVERGQAVLVAK
jgi:hypothetical protein